MSDGEDPFSRVDYRRMIAWGPRVEREAPFLREMLAQAPDPSVIDLGCGTGEHTAFFAANGCRAVGLDRSESMIDRARDHEEKGQGRFVHGDILEAPLLLTEESPFGMGICLGNMLPSLADADELRRFAEVTAALLAPGGRLLLQLLNYRRIREHDIRYLPLNFRPGDADNEEIVFLRILKSGDDGEMLFYPTTLRLRPDDEEEPVTVHATKRIRLRAWTDDDVRGALEDAGFVVSLHGDMQGGDYEPSGSHDLVVVATHSAVAH